MQIFHRFCISSRAILATVIATPQQFHSSCGLQVAAAQVVEFERNPLVETVIGCAIEVHSRLGPGLLESVYDKCLMHEFYLRGLQVQRQRNLPINYKGVYLDCGYRVDFVIEGALVLELKTVDRLLPIHKSQLLTYLCLLQIRQGPIFNFNVALMKEGIRSVLCPMTTKAVEPPEFAE